MALQASLTYTTQFVLYLSGLPFKIALSLDRVPSLAVRVGVNHMEAFKNRFWFQDIDKDFIKLVTPNNLKNTFRFLMYY